MLRGALRSVASQDVGTSVNVYVIDDASPASAEPDVAQVLWPTNFTVRVLKKHNGGPGSARNAGLDSLVSEKYVAFLDSDDRWYPHHLSSARYAFEQGFDFYTSETLGTDGLGRHAKFFNGALPLKRVGTVDWAHEFMEPLINYTIWGPISGSSTMVMTRQLIGDTRFNEELRSAGEDGLFTTTLAAKRPRVMVSTRTDTVLGRGVNIFSEGDWGSRQATLRSIHFMQSRILMKPLVKGFPSAERKLAEQLDSAWRGFWAAGRAATRRGNLPWREFLRLIRRYPQLLYSPDATG